MAKAAESVLSSAVSGEDRDPPAHDDVAKEADVGADQGFEKDEAASTLAKFGRKVMELTRIFRLPWASEQDDPDDVSGGEAGALTELAEQVEELRKQVNSMVEDVRTLAKTVEVGEGGPSSEVKPPAPVSAPVVVNQGRRGKASLDGQERTASSQAHFWKGVL